MHPMLLLPGDLPGRGHLDQTRMGVEAEKQIQEKFGVLSSEFRDNRKEGWEEEAGNSSRCLGLADCWALVGE